MSGTLLGSGATVMIKSPGLRLLTVGEEKSNQTNLICNSKCKPREKVSGERNN